MKKIFFTISFLILLAGCTAFDNQQQIGNNQIDIIARAILANTIYKPQQNNLIPTFENEFYNNKTTQTSTHKTGQSSQHSIKNTNNSVQYHQNGYSQTNITDIQTQMNSNSVETTKSRSKSIKGGFNF